MEAEATPAGQTLASYLRILRRRAWILVLCLVLIPVAAVFFSQRGVKLYRSSAEIYATKESFSPALTGIQATSGSRANGAENMVYLALTPRVARRTLQALNRSDRSPDALLAQTSVGREGHEQLLRRIRDRHRPDGRRTARHRICAPDRQVQERTGHSCDRKRSTASRTQARRARGRRQGEHLLYRSRRGEGSGARDAGGIADLSACRSFGRPHARTRSSPGPSVRRRSASSSGSSWVQGSCS